MSTWQSWGVYATTIVESGTQPPSSSLNWNRVENDEFADMGGNFYGQGLGCIQITSGQSEFLHNLYLSGDIDNRYEQYQGQIINFDLSDVSYLHTQLNSSNAKEVQRQYTIKYFNTDNASAMNIIANTATPDICKAYLVNIIILAPAWIGQLCTSPVAQTLDDMYSQMLSFGGSEYLGRFATLRDYLKTVNISSTVPYDFFNDTAGGTTSTTNNDGTSTPAHGSSGSPKTTTVKTPTTKLVNHTQTLKNGVFSIQKSHFQSINDDIIMKRNGKNKYLYTVPTTEELINNNNAKKTATPTPTPNPPNTNTPAPETAPTTSGNDDPTWLNNYIGQAVGFQTGQCYGLAQFWLAHEGLNSDLTGYSNAKDIWTNFPWGTGVYSNFEDIQNSSSLTLKSGDVVCCAGGNLSSQYGHVIIVDVVDNESDPNSDFSFYEQNWDGGATDGQNVRLCPWKWNTAYGNYGSYITGIVRKK